MYEENGSDKNAIWLVSEKIEQKKKAKKIEHNIHFKGFGLS